MKEDIIRFLSLIIQDLRHDSITPEKAAWLSVKVSDYQKKEIDLKTLEEYFDIPF
jgi:hypothetical protein